MNAHAEVPCGRGTPRTSVSATAQPFGHRRATAWRDAAIRRDDAVASAVFGAWLFAMLLFASVVAIALHLSELEQLTQLLRHLRVRWLLAAIGLQAVTYFCAAEVWRLVLAREHRVVGIVPLARMALMMLFANQAFPTAGLSGSAVVVRALRRRDIPRQLVMGALLIGLMTTYLAYLVAIGISLVILGAYRAMSMPLLIVTGFVALAVVAVPAGVVWYRESIAPGLSVRVQRLPVIGSLLDAIGNWPTRLLHDRSLMIRVIAFQLVEMLLDATTLQVMLVATGTHVAVTAVFGAYVIGSAVARVIPVPLGLGSFEASLVTMLHAIGVSIEAALAATLLLRGFTFWLPMLPGLWCARMEYASARKRVPRRASMAH